MLRISDLKINSVSSPEGLVSIRRVSWILSSNNTGVFQRTYEVQIAADADFLHIIYDTGVIESDESVNVELPGLALESAKAYYIRVKATDNHGETSDWCEASRFITGFVNDEWKPTFITGEAEEDTDKVYGTYLRHCFEVKDGVESAYLYSTALGIYQPYINGARVGTDELTPGWTAYQCRVLYQTYDITSMLKSGKNAVGGHVGAGWYKGILGFRNARNIYGERTAIAFRIVINYSDGTSETVDTDGTWKTLRSPVVSAEIYSGEEYDARLETSGWCTPEFDDSGLANAAAISYAGNVEAQEGARVKRFEEVKIKNIITTPEGDTVLDFGQNLSGTVTIKLRGKSGDTAKLRFFETLDSKGNAYYENLRTAKEELIYTMAGEQAEYSPSFTFYGFRYATVVSWPGELTKDSVIAYDLVSDMEPLGNIVCSNPDLNQLHHNVYWGMRGNFIDIPTDCPQRDERLGWTGDAQIFGRTACYLMNTDAFFTKWLRDLEIDQCEDGGVPHVVPNLLDRDAFAEWREENGAHSATAWADVAVILPWDLYLNYGDKSIISKQYNSMKGWIDFMVNHSEDYIWSFQSQFGDWVALDAEPGSYHGATPDELVCTAYFAYSTMLFAKMARIIGNTEDAEKYTELYKKVVNKFQTAFYNDDGTMTANTQTAHILSLHFDLAPEKFRAKTIEGLCSLLDANGGHLNTGFVGTPYFCFALSKAGRTDRAYDLLLEDDFPSWLYQVRMGATTVWEHWDGLKPDGTMWSADMNSFNHYAYGAVAEWMYSVMAGIDTFEDGAGFKHICIKPKLGGNLAFVDGSYKSPYGLIKSKWSIDGDKAVMEFTVPCNAAATVVFDKCARVINSGGLDICEKDGEFTADAVSGTYTVEYLMK